MAKKKHVVIVVLMVSLGLAVGFSAIKVMSQGWLQRAPSALPKLEASGKPNRQPVEYFSQSNMPRGIPHSSIPTTDTLDVSAYWRDNRVVDGAYSCVIYKTKNKQILAAYSVSSGDNEAGKVEKQKLYKDDSIKRSSLDRLIDKYCKQR